MEIELEKFLTKLNVIVTEDKKYSEKSLPNLVYIFDDDNEYRNYFISNECYVDDEKTNLAILFKDDEKVIAVKEMCDIIITDYKNQVQKKKIL